MNKLLAIGFATLLFPACASIDTKITDGGFEGLWQFPEKAVWIQIDNIGQVFQCRIDIDGAVISSRGTLREDSIEWVDVWEPDRIRRVGDTIFLKGPFGEFGFIKSDESMVDQCENPFS